MFYLFVEEEKMSEFSKSPKLDALLKNRSSVG